MGSSGTTSTSSSVLPPVKRERILFRKNTRRVVQKLTRVFGDRETMIFIAVAIGATGGVGAVFFRYLIALFQDLAWGEAGSPLEKIIAAPWYWRVAAPMVGGLLVGLIVKYTAPEAKGHGVPEVMDAVSRQGGVIRPVVVVAKSFASAICIATGGSVGREGPIVQVGSALGSTFGQWLRLSTPRIKTCVACGAAAGIAATFNAPIAGAFFAAEIILGEFAYGSFGAVVVSSVSATVVSRVMLGDVPAFEISGYSVVHPAEMLIYAVLGLIAGVAGVAFVQFFHFFEETFERTRAVPEFLKPVIGGLGIGLVGVFLPEIMGVGYETITLAIEGKVVLGVMVALFAGKLVATSFTLGSGGSGGVFAPSLFMGASLGGVVGSLAGMFAPFPTASPGAYAVVGMGAMVAAATHAPITAILIIFEMTGDYRVILGLMVSCILSTIVAQRIRKESIYTIKLFRRGIDLMAGTEINVLRRVAVQSIHRGSIETVSRTATLDDLYHRMVHSQHYEFFVVDEQGSLVGVVSVDDLRKAIPDLEGLRHLAIADDIMCSPPIFVREDDTLDVAMLRFGQRSFEELPVLPAGDAMTPIGTIRRQDVINAYNKEMMKADVGGALSTRLASAALLRTWETVGGYVMARMEVPPHLCGKELQALKLRQHHEVQVILIERVDLPGEERFILPTPTSVLSPGEHIIVFGKRENVNGLLDEAG